MEMGWFEPELACKRHQNHKQLQGVCPFCVRERLSQLAAASMKKSTSMISSDSCNSSPASSSGGNTSPGLRRHNRHVSEIMGSISIMSSGGLKKSRSMAFVPRKNIVGELKNGKKKKGFWSKLLHRERKKEILMHSKDSLVSDQKH